MGPVGSSAGQKSDLSLVQNVKGIAATIAQRLLSAQLTTDPITGPTTARTITMPDRATIRIRRDLLQASVTAAATTPCCGSYYGPRFYGGGIGIYGRGLQGVRIGGW